MKEGEIHPIKEAELTIPRKWYEVKGCKSAAIQAMVTMFASSNSYNYFFPDRPGLAMSLIGAGTYLIVGVSDRVSTSKAITAANGLRERGVELDFKECNPLVGQPKSAREFNWSKRTAAMDGIGLGLSAVSLGIAIPVFGIKLRASVSNFRKANRMTKAIEIVDQRAA